jgi:predicted glycosyltransferase
VTTRVLFYVQHLLGIGHVKRAATLVRAMGGAGMDVTMVSGGETVPVLDASDLKLIQLPSLRAADKYFKVLLNDQGVQADDSWKEDRRRRLLDLYDQLRPDVLVIELFPFGRRQMRFELLPLLEAAKKDARWPLIVSSVRDILVAKDKSSRNQEMVEAAEAWFDAVMVHGDPDLIPFDATFPLAERLGKRLHYTGYVVDQACKAEPDGGPGTGEVVVSTGGGAVSEPLLRAVLAARPLSQARDRTWRLLVGHNLPEDAFQAFRDSAPDGVIVERARSDFVRLLANCHLSISQGGYNTVMEILATGARAVIVPYAGGEETEQTLRGNLLAARGLLEVVEERDLSAETLARAIDKALARPRLAGRRPLRMDGAHDTAGFLAKLVAERAGV